MDFKKLFVLFAILFLSINVFAANPVFTGSPTITRAYNVVGDRNYYDFNLIMYSPIVADADGDLNEDSCAVGFAGIGFYPFTEANFSALDFNTDLNKCQVNLNYEWGNTGKMDLAFRIFDDAGGDANSTDMNWWLDNTAPETLAVYSERTLTLTATDAATPTGPGVGVKRIYYRVDDGAWSDTATNPLAITVPLGTHTYDWYAVDNFDNNEMRENSGDPRTKTVYSGDITASACTFLDLIMLVMAAFLAIVILFFIRKSELSSGLIMFLVMASVTMVIGIVIVSILLSSVCAL